MGTADTGHWHWIILNPDKRKQNQLQYRWDENPEDSYIDTKSNYISENIGTSFFTMSYNRILEEHEYVLL